MRMAEDELRMLGMSAPTLLKLLRAREARVLGRMHAEFKAGNRDQLTNLAEFATIRDQINDITSALRAFEHQEGMHHEPRNDDARDASTTGS